MSIMIEIIGKDERCAPRVFCDYCGRRIKKASEGNVSFLQKGKLKHLRGSVRGMKLEISISCKDCGRLEEKDYELFYEMSEFFYLLSNNIDMGLKKGEWIAKMMSKIGF